MTKVILWGSCEEYGIFCKYLHFEVLKGNMQIEAVCLNGVHQISRIDGIEVIRVEELVSREYDYLIDMNRQSTFSNQNTPVETSLPKLP